MTIYLGTTELVKPTGDDKISKGKLAYLQARHRMNVYDLILREFDKSGITKATLARRLGIAPEQVTRLLASPSNMTLDTQSDLLFAMTGTEPYCAALPVGTSDRSAVQVLIPDIEGIIVSEHTSPDVNQVQILRFDFGRKYLVGSAITSNDYGSRAKVERQLANV